MTILIISLSGIVCGLILAFTFGRIAKVSDKDMLRQTHIRLHEKYMDKMNGGQL